MVKYISDNEDNDDDDDQVPVGFEWECKGEMTDSQQQFCLRWNNFQANITSQFEALRDDEDFVDVTFACDGRRLQAHKVVLSACSPYFKELFKVRNLSPFPLYSSASLFLKVPFLLTCTSFSCLSLTLSHVFLSLSLFFFCFSLTLSLSSPYN